MIRVLLVEDEEVVREGIRDVLEAHDDIIVVGELETGELVLEAIATAKPDILLVDLAMPKVDGVKTIKKLRALRAAPAAIVLTTFDTDVNVLRALHHGAVGFLRKTTSTSALVAAVRAAATGESVLSRDALAAILGHHVARIAYRGGQRLTILTDQEVRIVKAVGEGASNAQIASSLFLSEATVRTYISKILRQLEIDNRVQLAMLWRDEQPPEAPSTTIC